ncbi:MAG: flavocytochrome c [Fusobacteriaceae bacterium]|jgi:flavocytochrome c|nr:flavocytochrome c [Fusobacteriaceae bacterium]
MKKLFSVFFAAVLFFSALFPNPILASGLSSVKDGTYQGTGMGNQGEIVVEVTIKGGRISSVTPVKHQETAGVADPAFERIPAGIVAGQTLAVDAVAGASMSSNGILDAAEMALEKAGADVKALKASQAAKSAARDTKKETYDIVVIGAGGAGLAAAITAQQAGAKVLVLEKMPRAGGNTIISGAAYNASDPERQKVLPMNQANHDAIKAVISRAPHDDAEKTWQEKVKKQYEEFVAAKKEGLFDSPELHMLQSYNGGDYVGTPELVETLAGNALDALHWEEGLGMEFTPRMFTVLGGLWPRAHQPVKPLGTGYIETDLAYISKHTDQITILYETKATELIKTDGRVTGVKAAGAATDYEFSAKKAVIIATGGFGASKELRQKFNGIKNLWPNLDSAGTTNHPGATGDGLVMAEAVGGSLTGMEWIQLLPMGDPKTGSLSGNIEQGVEDRFFVNKNGDRFVDEGARRDIMTLALFKQPDAFMWVICDKNSYPTPQTKNNFNESIEELIKAGRAFEGNTIAELAGKIGVPADHLQAAVDEFNKGVEEGKDKFGRTLWRIKIDTPPFYAGARIPTVHHTMGGIRINSKAQVLDADGKPIPGLYAAGEVTGGIHGSNRLGGNALADIHVFGRIAGTNAAKE